LSLDAQRKVRKEWRASRSSCQAQLRCAGLLENRSSTWDRLKSLMFLVDVGLPNI
jgi:transposase